PLGRRRVHGRLLQAAVGKRGGICGALTADVRRSSVDAAFDPTRRTRPTRPNRRRLEVLSRAQSARQDSGVRYLPARWPRPVRTNARARADAAQPGVVSALAKVTREAPSECGGLPPPFSDQAAGAATSSSG